MDVTLKEAVGAYRNYDSERTPCRVCYTSSALMIPIFPYEKEGIQLLEYVLLYELTSEKKSVFICEDCLDAIHRCAKNINYMRSSQHILPNPGSRHCWTCKTASLITLRTLPENSTKQIIFHRLKGLLVLGQSMWICDTCAEVVDDLEELLESVHKTEIFMLEERTIEETSERQNYETISKPFGDSHSKSRLYFMQTNMQAVLNIEPIETTTVTPPAVTYDDPIQELLALCATIKYDAIVSTGSLDESANESLNAENATSSSTYDPVPKLNRTPTVRRKLFDSPEKVSVCYYGNEYSDITQKGDPQMSDFKECEPIEKHYDHEERNNYQEKMPREDWGILLNKTYEIPTYVRANHQRNKQDNKQKISKSEKSIDTGRCIPPSAGRISVDFDVDPANSFYADSASVPLDPFMDSDFTFRLFCAIDIHDSSSEEKQTSTQA